MNRTLMDSVRCELSTQNMNQVYWPAEIADEDLNTERKLMSDYRGTYRQEGWMRLKDDQGG